MIYLIQRKVTVYWRGSCSVWRYYGVDKIITYDRFFFRRFIERLFWSWKRRRLAHRQGYVYAVNYNFDCSFYRYFTALRSEEHTSELQSRFELVCRLLLEKKNKNESSRL